MECGLSSGLGMEELSEWEIITAVWIIKCLEDLLEQRQLLSFKEETSNIQARASVNSSTPTDFTGASMSLATTQCLHCTKNSQGLLHLVSILFLLLLLLHHLHLKVKLKLLPKLKQLLPKQVLLLHCKQVLHQERANNLLHHLVLCVLIFVLLIWMEMLYTLQDVELLPPLLVVLKVNAVQSLDIVGLSETTMVSGEKEV